MARKSDVKAQSPAPAANDGDASVQSSEAPAPNIRLAHNAEPVTEGDLGWKGIVLPDAAAQRAGWHEPQAAEIMRLFGGRYKLIISKG